MAQSIAEIGYDPFNMVMGLVSNLCIGGSALAVAFHLKDKAKKGMISSFGITALCGVTEPAFYGSLIMRPKCLIGTAIGAVSVSYTHLDVYKRQIMKTEWKVLTPPTMILRSSIHEDFSLGVREIAARELFDQIIRKERGTSL